MNTFLIVSVALMALSIASGEKHDCGNHEVWSNCPTACEATCKSLHEPLKPCTMQCLKPGCVCEEGFVRNDKNECVSKNDCCDKNMVWSSCPSSCLLTCQNFFKPQECILRCDKPRCICKIDHVLNEKEECVPYRDCCGHNKKFSLCPSKCPLTCENCKNPPPCTLDCDKPGCICKPGFVLDKKDECVPIDTC